MSSGSEIYIPDNVVTLEEDGKRMANEFLEKRVLTNEINFFDRISKNINKNLIVRKRAPFHQKIATAVEVNRNILGKLLSYSMKTENKIDFKEALKYPLSPVPLSLCHVVGTKRSYKKADIYSVIDYRATIPEPAYNNVKTYIFNLMLVIRCVEIFKTIKELSFKILITIPKGCHRVDVVTDSYRTVFWKNKTKDARGAVNRIIIKFAETKIIDSREFLNNNHNKTEFVDQIFDWFKINRAKVLSNKLRTTNIYLSKENFCMMLTYSPIREVDELTSTQEEADFRLVLHAQHSLTLSTLGLTDPLFTLGWGGGG